MHKHFEITPSAVHAHVRAMKNGGSLTVDLPDPEDIEGLPDVERSSVEMLSDGEWFTRFPEKLIGTIKYDKDRYGKSIMVITGDISDLSKIPGIDLDQFLNNKDYGATVEQSPIAIEIEKPDNANFVKGVIRKSKVSVGGKVSQKARSIQPAQDAQIQTAAEIFQKLNPSISQSEIQAYIWYKESIGQKLSQSWYDFAQYDVATVNVEDWVRSGTLCYFRGELLPQALYLSGNIYDKIRAVVTAGETRGEDAAYIENTYGADVLANQISLVNRVYTELYSKRLIITGNSDDNSLIIKPVSKLARTFMVSELNDYEKFKWWASKGVPNWEREDGSEWQKTDFEELSLTDAFCYWLLSAGRKIEIRGNITHRDIIYFYIQKRTKQAPSYASDEEIGKFKAQLERTKAKSVSEGNRLFLKFLEDQLTINDKVALETSWNSQYNNYIAPDFAKIPVAFSVAREFYGEMPFEVKAKKREAVAFIFNEGSGCLAYDVGVGKTMSDIMVVEQFLEAGYCRRPVIVVPNQTFKQWVSEIKGILPHRKINPLFNLGVDYIDGIKDENGEPQMVDEGSITVITYEGLKAIGFNEQTEGLLMTELYEILNQGGASELMSDKKKAGFFEKLESLIGRSLKGTVIPIETLGFDHITFDEAHALKKVFTSVKGEVNETTKKRDSRKQYSINSGEPSDTALKGFMLAQYILRTNNYRNVVLLTATPFTNSPLEVFSMLALVAYHQLARLGINNINDFFDTFIDADTDLVINHKLQPEYKQVIKGFNNLPSLQRIILRFFNKKDGEDVGVVRPNKIVVPYLKKMVNNQIVDVPENERVSCYIQLNEIQRGYMAEVIAYAETGAALGQGNTIDFEEESDGVIDTQSVEVSEDALSVDEKSGVRAIKSMNYSRSIALSPYLYAYHTLGKPTYKTYIETSPKLQYVIECIRSVKKYHQNHDEPMSGQVIYMDRGVEYFPLIAEYLVKEVGFEPHEIGMIYSKGMSEEKKRLVQDGFLGRRYNEAAQEYENISDAMRIKVLIGSSSIKEGMNLQKKSTVLYNCYIDWNPTDMIQLAGRIWRQQNEFMYVRIVNPLMIDSIDIFMFQKLEEKTSRINTIWSNDGRSVLKLEEINPNEIKYALIKDPKIIAKIEIDEKAAKLNDDRKSNETIRERIENFNRAVKQQQNYKAKIDEEIMEYAPAKFDDEYDSKYRYLNKLYTTDKPKDKDGLVMLSNWEKSPGNIQFYREKYGEISPLDKPYKPYWFPYYGDAQKLITKELRDLIKPRSIDPDFTDDYLRKLDSDNQEIDKQLEFLKSEDYVEKRVIQIIEYREANKIEEKTVPQLVSEFERLNYLLSEKRLAKASVIEVPISDVNVGDVAEAIDVLKELLQFADKKDRREIREAIEILQLLE